jgi:putative hydroxymethylpyrimidine transport system substrate-binding protein
MRNIEPVELKAMGYNSNLFFPENYGVPTYSQLVFTARKGEDPDTIARFDKAVAMGAAYLRAHPDESWELASQAYPTQLAPSQKIADVNHSIWLATIPYFAVNPAFFNSEQYQAFARYMVKQGLI